MPGATLDYEARTFTVSQSWLQDFQRCPERARQELLNPTETRNDATGLGTAFHHFMEARLSGSSFDRARSLALSYMQAAMQQPEFCFVKVMTPETVLRHLETCIEAADRHILPQVPEGGVTERKLTALLAETNDGWRVVLEGRPDYVDPRHRTWDWKSASSEYNAHETANWAIQPTSYTFLVSVDEGIDCNHFTYAIAIKPHGVIQFIDTIRGQDEWAWLGRVSLGALILARTLIDHPWPVVHTHYLCDPKWCPAWDGCRGAYIHKEVTIKKVGAAA